MRWSRVLTVLALAMFVVACGGQPASDGGNGGGDGNSTEESEPAEETQGDGGGDGGDGGGDGGSVDSGDLEALEAALEPPDATETQRTSAEGVVFVIWETPESPDSLVGYYENAIEDAGMEIFSTTNLNPGTSWLFTEGGDSTFGGVVTVIPSTSGGSGSSVSIQVSGTQ